MRIFQHRVNTVEQCATLSPMADGIEIDIRSWRERLICAHDPLCNGQPFDQVIDRLDRAKFLICNIKEEGIEEHVEKILTAKGFTDFAFLDSTIPFINKSIQKEKRYFFARISYLEPFDVALRMCEFVDWLWIDTLKGIPVSNEQLLELKSKFGTRTCLVSPELISLGRADEIPSILEMYQNKELCLDAICTKYPKRWSAENAV